MTIDEAETKLCPDLSIKDNEQSFSVPQCLTTKCMHWVTTTKDNGRCAKSDTRGDDILWQLSEIYTWMRNNS